jgi:DME family drug/metabolite transporter
LLVLGRDHSADRRVLDPGLPENHVAAGIAIALLAGLSYAVYTFVAARLISGRPSFAAPSSSATVLTRGLDHRAVISSIQIVAAVPLIVVLAFTAGPVIAQPLSWAILLYLAIVPTAIGHSLLAFSLGRMSASTSTVFSLFEPVVAVVLAAVIVGEAITPLGWLGLAVVLAGLALLSAPARRP